MGRLASYAIAVEIGRNGATIRFERWTCEDRPERIKRAKGLNSNKYVGLWRPGSTIKCVSTAQRDFLNFDPTISVVIATHRLKQTADHLKVMANTQYDLSPAVDFAD
jgi:hypothetical protein